MSKPGAEQLVEEVIERLFASVLDGTIPAESDSIQIVLSFAVTNSFASRGFTLGLLTYVF